jgi:hypothetical protein
MERRSLGGKIMKKSRHKMMKVVGYTMHASKVLEEFDIDKTKLATDIVNYKETGLRSMSNKGGVWFQPDQINERYTKKPVKSVSALDSDGQVSAMGGTGLVKDLGNYPEVVETITEGGKVDET